MNLLDQTVIEYPLPFYRQKAKQALLRTHPSTLFFDEDNLKTVSGKLAVIQSMEET